MKNIAKHIRIISLFSRYSAKAMLNNRLGVVLFTFGKLLRFGMFFSIVYFLVSTTQTLKGYDVNQALVFYLSFNLIDTISQLLFREVYRFRPLIISGDFDTILVKPYHPFARILVGGVDVLDFFMLGLYIPLTIYFIFASGTPNAFQLTVYSILVLNALVIATAFHISVLALGIITTQIDHAIMIYRDVTHLGRFPMDIYREPIRSVFTFVIPVGLMMTVPVKALFGLLDMHIMFFAFLFSGAFLYLSLLLWRHSLRKYQSWGG